MFKRLINPINSDSFFLLGSRGTGKTSFLKEYFAGEDPVWIDLLDPAEEDLFTRRPQEFSARLESCKPTTWVVVDEIQKVPSLLNYVHGFIESKQLKFALTGSSARRLRQKGVNLLAGRAFTNYAFPLTHYELGDHFKLTDILQWGSLPKIFSLTTDDSRAAYLRSYALNYVTTEIQAEQWVRKIEPFRKFLPIAAQMNGKILNYAKIAREVGVDVTTVISYFDILEDTLIGTRLEAYHESLRKRQTQKPKFYFFDLGVKRALEHTLTVNLLPQTYAYGDAFEHFIVCEILRMNMYYSWDYTLSYLRTKDDAEVDLIVERPGKGTVYIEIKSTDSVGAEHCKSLSAFAKGQKKTELMLLSRDTVEKTFGQVTCLPWDVGLKKLFSI
jgi:predicted AAA+ superfamily ATPase